ncbi:hypothetical protein MP228_012579 [Amoeboaphelidium protococcarum]|nr:hypothetical protein MP228_012579 [Amoeboaphelidium protococcarum]
MEVEQSPLNEVRQMWQFAALSQFMHTFSAAIKLEKDDDFSTDELETMIIGGSEELINDYVNIIMKMMRMISPNIISRENFQSQLEMILDQFEHDLLYVNQVMNVDWNKYHKRNTDYGINQQKQNAQSLEQQKEWVDRVKTEDTSKWDPICKVLLLYSLSELVLLVDPSRLLKRRKAIDADADDFEEEVMLRVEPLGSNYAESEFYYLFDDNRLYKIAPDARGKCQLLCGTLSEWQDVANRLGELQHKNIKSAKPSAAVKFDRALYDRIVKDCAPQVIEHIQEEFRLKNQRLKLEQLRSLRVTTRSSNRKPTPEVQQQQTQPAPSVQNKAKNQAVKSSAPPVAVETRPPGPSDRERRMMEREQKLIERQEKKALEESRRLHAEQQKQLKLEEKARKQNNNDNNNNTGTGGGGGVIKQKKRKKSEIAGDSLTITGQPQSWYFDCYCNVRSMNYDDGSPLVSCSQCQVWKHIACVDKYSRHKINWDKDDFSCWTCSRPLYIEKMRRQSSKSAHQQSSTESPSDNQQNQSPEEQMQEPETIFDLCQLVEQ